MGKRFSEIGDQRREFIEQQKMFFVGTADPDGRVNVSPKGMDSLKVMGDNRVVWLNMTCGGNETAAHVVENDRMTIMFCAFEGSPMILRLFGHAKVIHPRDSGWDGRKGEQDLYEYWGNRNQVSIDGKPTRIISDESVPIATPGH